MATTTTFNGKKVHQGMIKSQKTRVGDFIIAFIIFLTMMICLLPMVNVLASSLSSSEHLIRNDVFLWPKGWNFEAYKTILSDSKYTWSLAWTGILTVVCTVLSLVLTVCTAFPLIYKNLRGGKVINFIAKVALIVFSCTMLRFSVALVAKQMSAGQTTPVMKVPMYVIYISLVISFALVVINQILMLVGEMMHIDMSDITNIDAIIDGIIKKKEAK